MATGGGKTFFALLCLADFLESRPEGAVYIVVPTLALQDQWLLALNEDLGVDAARVASWSGRGRPSHPAQINVLVTNTARSVLGNHLATEGAMLIVDECHRIGSAANSAILAHSYSSSLGLSATPESEYDDRFDMVVGPALGEIVFKYDILQALADGIVAPFELVNVRVPLLSEEKRRYDAFTKQLNSQRRRPDADEGLVRILLQRRAAVAARARYRVPVAVKLLESHRGERAIVFHESVRAAEQIAEALDRRGHRVTSYHTGLGQALRLDNLRLFKRGQRDVLVSCRALDEGLNVPDVGLAVIASGTASGRQRVQRLGRVLRAAHGKASATIYSLFATTAEENRLLSESSALAGITSVSWRSATRRND